MKIAVVGTGYVGLVSGVCFAEKGHDVICIDVDEQKISMLSRGISPIYEQDLEELMKNNAERLVYTTDYRLAYQNADAIFIAVGTPEKKDGAANLSFVFQVMEQIGECMEQDAVIVIKSTVPIGTNEKAEVLLTRKLRKGVTAHVVSNPEFLAQGTAVKDTLHGARIIIGTENDAAAAVMKEIYQNFQIPMLFMNRKSAEMVKYASNDFLALKVSYVNEIANFCEMVDADVEDVMKGVGLDPRIGSLFLKAGIGYGGSCFPKDTKALHWLANYYDNELKTVKAAIEVNANQKIRLIKKARKYYKNFDQLTIAVLGLSFKPGTDDLREAPSLDNIPILLEDGALVKVWDPIAIPNFKLQFRDEVTYCNTIDEALEGADLCFILTEWEQIKSIKPEQFLQMKKPIILDGRNCFDLKVMEQFPVIYDSIGRGCIKNLRRETNV